MNASTANLARPRVLVTVPCFEPGFRGGGPVRSVASILDSTSTEVDILLVTSDRDLGDCQPYDGLSGRCVPRGNATVCYLNPRSALQVGRVLKEVRRAQLDLLYVNSLWHPQFSLSVLILAWFRVIRTRDILISPRGELTPGALRLGHAKKRFALRVLRPVISALGASWHASAEREAQDILRQFPSARVIVSMNPTQLPAQAIPPQTTDSTSLSAVFISRVSPKKNLKAVISALLDVSATVTLDIYGPREDRGYWNECAALIARCPSNVTVRYCGELRPDEVRSTFSRYDCFLFPTLGENFGHVIAESLSASCPVICTDTTPWTDVIVAGGGIIVDQWPASLTQAVDTLAASAPSERYARRLAAGAAYSKWRGPQQDTSILDIVLRQSGSGEANG